MHTGIKLLIITLMLTMSLVSFGKKRQTVDLIIFMGQSNMAGRGVTNEQHPEDAMSVDEEVAQEFRAYSDPTRLYPVTKTFGRTEDNPQGIDDHQKKTGGMVPDFVRACYEVTHIPIISVSASEGGTRTEQWLPGGKRLTDAQTRFTTTKKWLQENGYRVRHSVMVWTQGESDADNHVSPEKYQENLRQIVDAMATVGVEHCFLIQIGQYNGKDKSLSYIPIQEAQEDFCRTNDDCTMVSRLFPTFKDRGMMKDSYHYFQDAYNLVGQEAGTNTGLILRKHPRRKK